MTKDLNRWAGVGVGGFLVKPPQCVDYILITLIFSFKLLFAYFSFAVLEMETKVLPNCLPVPSSFVICGVALHLRINAVLR